MTRSTLSILCCCAILLVLACTAERESAETGANFDSGVYVPFNNLAVGSINGGMRIQC